MRQGTKLLIGCGVATLLGICGLVIVFLVWGGALMGMVVSGGPYGVGNRPMPVSVEADTLAPPTVGTFTRTSLSGTPQMGITAMYDGQGGQIMLQVRIFPSTDAARNTVSVINDQLENAGGSRLSMTGDVFETNAVRYVGDGTARMAWNRGTYFFDVQAPDADTLDSFMNAFPY